MKFISIDCETTGLNPETCEILSLAAVLEDTNNTDVPVDNLPHVHFIFKKDFIKGEPYALNMNKNIIEIIKEGTDKRLISIANFEKFFTEFLEKNDIDIKKIKVAGKNFSSFDRLFIDNMDYGHSHDFKFHHRVLDVGPLFVDFKNDVWLPDLSSCMRRAGVEGVVTHDAYEDAKDVIKVLRTKY